MKIIQESSSRMVLKDHNYGQMIGSPLVLLLGLWLALLCRPGDVLYMVFGGIFALAGLWGLLTVQIITIVLDKGSQKCTFSTKAIIGGKYDECRINEISELKLDKKAKIHRRKGRMHKDYEYYLVFVLKGKELGFEFGRMRVHYGENLSLLHERKRKEAEPVANFLGLPLSGLGAPGQKPEIEESLPF